LVEREETFKYYEIIERSNYQYDNFLYARLALAEILGFFLYLTLCSSTWVV